MTIPVTKPKKNMSGVPLWTVTIEQRSKLSGIMFNTFVCNVNANTKEEARQAALDEIKYYSKLQTLHVQDNPLANAQARPWMKQTWGFARNIVISIKRVRG